LKDPEIDARIILKWILEKLNIAGGGMDWIDLAQERQLVGTCECGNEPLGSIKCGEFLELLRTC
jgi:hypothetical protein